MKKVILILLIGIFMNPTFHLYGMKITLAGDLTAARDRAHLARLLMFQTKMVNVNNLDIIQNNLRLNDGTHVYVLSQHGFDSAQIYVPPKPMARVPRPKERIEQLYWPAWEAYDEDDNHVGYVIARGEGWQAPYEFIPKNDGDKSDLFEWGQWLENYGPDEKPFDDLEEYLTHKFIYADRRGDEERTFWDVPPSGTRNRFFEGISSDFVNDDPAMGGTAADECCYFDGEVYWFSNTIEDSFTYDKSTGYTLKLTGLNAGELGEIPDEKYDAGGNVLAYEMGAFVPDIAAKQYSKNDYEAGTVTFQNGVMGGSNCDQLREDASDDPVFSPAATLESYLAIGVSPIYLSLDYDYFPTSPTYGQVVGAYVRDTQVFVEDFEDLNERTEINDRDYITAYSSVQDVNHYAAAFAVRDRVRKYNRTANWHRCQISPGPYDKTPAAVTDTDESTNLRVEATLSGTTFEIWDYSDWLADRFSADIPIRYYNVGGLEFMLGAVKKRNPSGVHNARYFYARKGGENLRTEYSVNFDSHTYEYCQLDGLTYDGRPIRIRHKFRLIKEEIITEEEI